RDRRRALRSPPGAGRRRDVASTKRYPETSLYPRAGMALVNRLVKLIWGEDVDPALRPVLAVRLAGSIAGAAGYPFLGVWAVKELGAPQSLLAFGYLAAAVLSGVVGYVGGHTSDRIGRRPLILIGGAFQAVTPLVLLLVGHHVYLGLIALALLPV